MISASAIFLFLKPYLWAFLMSVGTSFIQEYLKRKTLADAGAAAQRAAQDAENARAATGAAKIADQVHDETDDQFAADAGAWR